MGVDAKMFVRVKQNLTDKDIKRLSYIFGSAFHNDLFLGHDEEIYYRPLEKISLYTQDGPDIHPEKDEIFLGLHLNGRYYGPGYERGPLMTFISIAEFLEALIPNCEVWYGGDSSGVCAIHFDYQVRKEYLKYFIENNARDKYNRAFDNENDGPYCPVCDVKMVRNGWGPNFKAFSCMGCGWNHTKKDGQVKKGFSLR